MGEASVSPLRTLESLDSQLNLLGRTMDLMRGLSRADCGGSADFAKVLGLDKADSVSVMTAKDTAVAKKALAQAVRLTKACLNAFHVQDPHSINNSTITRQVLFHVKFDTYW